MRSIVTWGGVLAGSVVLGVGMYGLVVAPATDGLEVLGITAAPGERPTVLRTSDRKPKRTSVPAPRREVPAADPVSEYEGVEREAEAYEAPQYGSDEYEAPERESEESAYTTTSSSSRAWESDSGESDESEDSDSDHEDGDSGHEDEGDDD